MKTSPRRTAVLLPVALFAVSVQSGAEEQTAAVLKLREVDFFYRSSVAVFSCVDLQNRIASIFRGLGARDDVEVRVNNCNAIEMAGDMNRDTSDSRQDSSFDWGASGSATTDPFGDRYGNRYTGRPGSEPRQSTHIRVRMMMPVVVTPEILQEMERDKSRRELISRVTGNAAAGLNEPIVFPAERRVVELSRKTADLDPEECELLEQMVRSVFRELDLRVVGGRPNCGRDRISHIPLKVDVEALMPVMPEAPQILPPEGSTSEPDPAATEEEKAAESEKPQ